MSKHQRVPEVKPLSHANEEKRNFYSHEMCRLAMTKYKFSSEWILI